MNDPAAADDDPAKDCPVRARCRRYAAGGCTNCQARRGAHAGEAGGKPPAVSKHDHSPYGPRR